MSTTTVRVTTDDRRRLDRLLSRRRALDGERVTLQQFLHEVLALAEQRFEELGPAVRPLDDQSWRRLRRQLARHRWQGSASDIDDVVYGAA